MIEFRDQEEKDFWKEVYIAVSRSSNCDEYEAGVEWADYAITELRKREPESKL